MMTSQSVQTANDCRPWKILTPPTKSVGRQYETPDSRRQRKRKRIVIVGGGFAGIAAARALKRCDAEVVLIDRRNHHIFQPLLYQVATAVLAPSEIAAPIRQLAEKQKNLSVMLAEVTGVDLNSRSVDASCPGRRRSQDRIRLS